MIESIGKNEHARVGLRARNTSQYENVLRSHDASIIKGQTDLINNHIAKG
jgi:hypothetical protein